jgi:hypothetical protein
VKRNQRIWLLAAGAAFAAAAAHVCVDVAGDYLLAHDAYDDVTHHSRVLVLAFVGALALVATIRVFGDILTSSTRNANTLLRSLHGALGHPLLFATQTALLSVAGMAAMESLDGALSGDFESWTALFGGSVLLGAGTAAVCGFIVGRLVHCLVRWLAKREPRIAAFVLAAFRPRTAVSLFIAVPRIRAAAPLRRGLLLSCSGRKRGPPLAAPG